MEKYFWMVTEQWYGKLRKVDGCDKLTNLKATVTDGKHIKKIADKLGVPKENRFINSSPSIDDLKETYKTLMKLSRKKSYEKKRHVFFIYFGGHGATQAEKQVFLLNSEDPKKAVF